LVELSLHIAYDAKVNDLDIWRAIEDAGLEALHQLSLLQICQLEWATTMLKPKKTSARFNTMLTKKAIDATASADELIYILQGFRSKRNKDIYQRVRKTLITRKFKLFPPSNKGEEKQRAE
jgi:oligoribonuclease NrnB/cAMP/cGMP phosphodiesterase (DHH superfamily)